MNKKHLVVLTGAGVSAESGLKTFRDSDGLWMGYNIEDVATPRAFAKDPALVLDFYNMRRKEVKQAQPNDAHKGLAELEKDFNVTIITQNIDDLHERGGSSNVLHLHGEIFKMFGVGSPHEILPINGDIHEGDKAADGSQLRPFIVWFEEPVPMIEDAVLLVQNADIIAVIGTSLQVYPAAGLLDIAADHIPKFILDKSVPSVGKFQNITKIEMPATEGVRELRELLLRQK